MKSLSKSVSFITTITCIMFALLSVQSNDCSAQTIYSVGAGQPYPNFASLPWPMADGDVVEVHPGTYNEKFQVSRGITIRGVDGTPVLNMAGATTASPYVANQTRGGITIYRHDTDSYGTKPNGVRLENLKITGASSRNTFYDTQGSLQTYTGNAACIYGIVGENVAIVNCEIEDAGNGIFAASGDVEALTCRNWLIEGCVIHDYGTVGSDRHHGTYMEVAGMTYRNNLYLDRYPGAHGSMLKDRSSGTVIESNTFSGTGARTLDLVDREGGLLLVNEPNYGMVVLRGNTYNIPANGQTVLIHFGGDTGLLNHYKTHLFVEYETINLESDQSISWRKILFDPETDLQKIDIRNTAVNHYAASGKTPSELSILELTGVAEFYGSGEQSYITGNWTKHRSGVPSSNSDVLGTEFVNSEPTSEPTPPPSEPTPPPSEPSVPVMQVLSIEYAGYGGKLQDRHFDVSVMLLDENNNPVSGASVAADIACQTSEQFVTGTTDEFGMVIFSLKNTAQGTWSTSILDVVADGYEWDGNQVTNSYSK